MTSIGRPRSVVADLPAYRPGKGAKEAELEHGIADAIKLASNENPAPPLDAITSAVVGAATGVNRYADHRASALRAALAGRERLPAMGEAGRAIVERRFSWPAVTDRLLALYAEVLGGG